MMVLQDGVSNAIRRDTCRGIALVNRDFVAFNAMEQDITLVTAPPGSRTANETHVSPLHLKLV